MNEKTALKTIVYGVRNVISILKSWSFLCLTHVLTKSIVEKVLFFGQTFKIVILMVLPPESPWM